ncbi:hypothetical protein, partial [Devosia sp.]|uniref:hypothetical protein n=1 Tax=Devosia sp. TaxID=1871048 RepID=UPI002EFF40E4
MRLRNWLLTGTSLAVLAFASVGTTHAQDADLVAAYEAYAAAQAAGDADATQSALAALTELCIVGGYASVEDCIAAIQAQAEPAPAEAPAPAPAPAPAEEPAPAEQPAPEPAPEPAPVEEPTPPPAEPAPAEPAPAEQPAAQEPSGPTQEELQAQFTADLNAALQQYQDALNMAAAGDYDAARPQADAAEARIRQLCLDNGYPTVEACIGQTLPPLPEPEPEPEPAPQPEAAPAEAAPAAEQPAPA